MSVPKILIVVLLVAVAIGGAYVVTRPEEGPPGRTDVVVIGDALLFDGTDNRERLIEEFTAAGYNAQISGYEGETIASAHETIWPDMAESDTSHILVIALGTNDAHIVDGEREVSLLDSREALGWWLRQAERIPCVVVVGVNEGAEAWGLDVSGPGQNEMMRSTAERYENSFFVPWEPEEELDGIEAVFLGDEGRAAYRRNIIDGVIRSC